MTTAMYPGLSGKHTAQRQHRGSGHCRWLHGVTAMTALIVPTGNSVAPCDRSEAPPYQDPAGTVGFSASNAISGTTP